MHNNTKKLYVGSSANLHSRLSDHIKSRSSNILLQRATSKYGLSNFSPRPGPSVLHTLGPGVYIFRIIVCK